MEGPIEKENTVDHCAPCGLLRTRPDGVITRVNRTFCEWIGQPPEALVGERRLQDLFTAGGRIFHQTHWLPLLQMQGSVSEVKLEIIRADGEKVPMVLNACLVREGNEVVGHDIAAFVARDRDKYEKELLLARKRLQKLVEAEEQLRTDATDRALFAEQMIGIVSHDLRNPLSTIGLGAEVLAAGELSAPQRRTLERIARATGRATRLVVDLLDFTRARIGGGVGITREPLDLHQAVGDAIDELALTHPNSSLRHVRQGVGQCEADALRLAQLIGNLVSNAVAYGTPNGTITITSTVEGDKCRLAVHNKGAPIPPNIRETIFSPMVRATEANSAARSVGLGLYIVREIAIAHDGTVDITSTADDGTTFTVAFPA